MSENALFDSYIHLHSAVGEVFLDGDILTFQDGMQGFFAEAGFEVTGGGKGRRLQSAFEMVGLFNLIPEYKGWSDVHDVPPRIPETFEAHGFGAHELYW